MLVLGVTGSRHGPTDFQAIQLKSRLRHPLVTHVRHGDCIGVDEFCHSVAIAANKSLTVHPPTVSKFRAWCGVKKFNSEEELARTVVLPTDDYHVRNHSIVDACNHLLVVPRGLSENARSGTWSTLRYAERAGRSYTIVWPDGGVYSSEDLF